MADPDLGRPSPARGWLRQRVAQPTAIPARTMAKSVQPKSSLSQDMTISNQAKYFPAHDRFSPWAAQTMADPEHGQQSP